MKTVAVLGLGKMGTAIAGNIAAAGFRTTVYNRTVEAARRHSERYGTRIALTPRQAASASDVVITMLADDAALNAVYHGPDGILAGLRRGALAIDMGTSGPTTVRALAPHVAAAGASLIDAPVSGSTAAAEAGTLTVLAGGDREAVAKAQPVLDAVGSTTRYLGGVGCGAAMKLALNVVVHSIDQALAEALVLAECSGISRDDAYGVFADSAVTSPVVAFRKDKFLDPDGAPTTFQIALAHKDLQLASALAEAVGARLPQTRTALSVLQEVIDSGHGAEDVANVAVHLRRLIRQSPDFENT